MIEHAASVGAQEARSGIEPASSLLLTDFYELAMFEAYLEAGMTRPAVFEFFVRKLPRGRSFLLAGGLEQVLGFLETARFGAAELSWLESTGRFRPRTIEALAAFRSPSRVYGRYIAGRTSMTYRTILADLTADDQIEARLNVARILALRFEAALIGMHVMSPPIDPAVWQGGMSVYIPSEFIEAQRKGSFEAKGRARAIFDRICGAEPKAVWREAEGNAGLLLAEAAHASDLVVTARGDTLGTTKLLVTAAGVPVLALPSDAPRDFAHVVLVAWKGSREAARAVHDALPFLHAAKRVILCAVGERAAAGLGDAAAMLERHQVPASPERVKEREGAAGRSCWRRPPRTGRTFWSWAPTATRGCASSSSAALRNTCWTTRRCRCSSAAERRSETETDDPSSELGPIAAGDRRDRHLQPAADRRADRARQRRQEPVAGIPETYAWRACRCFGSPARSGTVTIRNLDRLFKPASVALFGASDRPPRWGRC